MKKKIITFLLTSSSCFCLHAQLVKDSISQNVVYYSQELATRYIIQLTSPAVSISTIEAECESRYRFNSNDYLALRTSLINKALKKINTEQEDFLTDFNALTLKSINGEVPKKKIVHRYNRALNGFAIEADSSLVSAIVKMRHFKNITKDRLIRVNDDISNAVIGAPAVWQQTGATGKNIKIGILDTGIDPNHPDLKGKVLRGYDFVNNDTIPFDDHGHGTHCAGIAAANGISLKGVAPGALLLPIKVIDANGNGSFTNIIAGVNYAMDPDSNAVTNDGVNILNISLGGTGSPDDPLAQAINNAFANNMLCVVAAGNKGNNYYTIGTPGCAKSALTVGATDNNDKLAAFSSCGPVLGSFQVKPEVVAPGVGIYSTLPNGTYGSMSGTSMAAPHVAGAAALLMELHPGWSPAAIKAALIQSAKDIGQEIWKQGKGRIDIPKAAQIKTAVSPSIVSFGNINSTTWTGSESLTVYNLSGIPKKYTISTIGNIPSGILITYPTSILLSGSARFNITISIDSSKYHFPPSIPSIFRSTLLIASSTDSCIVPLVINKAELATFTFNKIPDLVFILDSTIKKEYQPGDTTLTVVIDNSGQHDIMTFFDGITTTVVRENVLLSNTTHLRISSTEAINEIEVTGVDQLGDTLIIIDGLEESLLNKNNGLGLQLLRIKGFDSSYNIKSIKRKISNLSNRYRYALEAVSLPQWNKTRKLYFFPHEFSAGITATKIVSNTKNEFLCINRKFPAAYSRSNTYLAYYSLTKGISSGHWNFDSLSGINKDNIFTEYVLPFPSLEYPLRTVSSYHLFKKKGSTPNIDNDSLLFITGNEVYRIKGVFECGNTWQHPIYIPLSTDTFSLNYGLSPTHYDPMFYLQDNTLHIFHRGQVFYNSCYDLALGKIEYKGSFNNGKSFSGVIYNDAGYRLGLSPIEPVHIIPIDSSYKNIQFKYSGGSLDLFNVLTTATHYRKTENVYPARIRGFQFRENGILTDHLTKGKLNTISISNAGGHGYLKCYIKPIQDTIWRNISLKQDPADGLWKGALPTDLAAGYYDAKVIGSEQYDSLVYTVEPAFVFKSDLCNTADTSMVHPVKVKSSSKNNIFCNTNTPITLSASGADVYKWSTHEDGSSINIHAPGIFSVQGANLNGCSDTSSVYIKIESAHGLQNIKICEGDSFNGHSSSGTYLDTLKTNSGCDSLNTLNLTVNPVYKFDESYSICEGETYFWHGHNYSTANTYTASYKSINGCDSTYTLNLKVNPIYTSTETYSICRGETFHWHGNDYSVADTYTEYYKNQNGCDSICTLILHVDPLNTGIVQNGNTLTAISIADSYQWVNCDKNYDAIIGEVNQNFTASSSGNYAVIITQKRCMEISACFQIIATSISSVTNNEIATVYPNPISNELNIEIKGNSKQEITFEIFNSIGQMLVTGCFKNRTIIQTSKFPTGVYLIKLKDKDTYYFYKVAKE